MSACEAVLAKAKDLHVDECEAFFAERKIITVRITDSEIAEIKQNMERSLAVRIIHEKKISSAKTSNVEKNDIVDRKSTRLNSSHIQKSRMPSSA